MPRKSHRVAARQAELSRKKRRRKGEARPYVPPSQPLPIARDADGPQGEAVSSEVLQKPLAPAPRPAKAEPVSHTATHAPYLWKELRRIGGLTLFILAIIGVLTVFLR